VFCSEGGGDVVVEGCEGGAGVHFWALGWIGLEFWEDIGGF